MATIREVIRVNQFVFSLSPFFFSLSRRSFMGHSQEQQAFVGGIFE
jgi:hypothetical protein